MENRKKILSELFEKYRNEFKELNEYLYNNPELGLQEYKACTAHTNILKKYGFIKIIGDNEEANYVGIISFVIDNISSDSMAPIFSQKNIIVRTGLHCAPLAHKFLDTFPTGTIRLSTSYFTNKKDFEELIMLLDYIETNI